MTDLFVSYSRQDLDRVEKLAAALEAAGLSVWWDRRIRSGDSFDRVIEHAIADAKIVIVAWSRHSTDSTWVRAEAGFALEHNKLVPVRLDEAAPPLRFLHVHTIDLSTRDGDIDARALARLIADLKEMVGGAAAPATVAAGAGEASAPAPHAAPARAPAARQGAARQKAIALAAAAAAILLAAGLAFAFLGGGKKAEQPDQASVPSAAKGSAAPGPSVAEAPPTEAAGAEKAAQPSASPPAPSATVAPTAPVALVAPNAPVALVAPAAPAAAPAPPAPAAPAAPFNPAADHQVEIAFWDSIKDSKNVGELEAYLEKYPDGDFAGIARGRLAALKAALAAPPPAPAAAPTPAPAPAAPAPAPAVPAPEQLATAPPPPVERGPELEVLEKDMVAAHAAPLREAPRIKAKQVGRVREGESVHVAGKVKSSDWYAVETKDQPLAYVAAAVLEDPADYRKRKEDERQKEAAREAQAAAQRTAPAASAPSPAPAPAPAPQASALAGAAAGATRYVGHLACEKIPGLTNATVLAPMTIVANGAQLEFSRPVYSFDDKQPVATERGTGKLASDGTVTLEGHMQGPIGHFDSSYQGTLKDGQIELKGVENIPSGGKIFARDCKASLARQ